MLHTGGPLALINGFVLVAASLSIMMQCLGEMAVVLPISGSFTRYAARFFDPALGFAVGWQYWYSMRFARVRQHLTCKQVGMGVCFRGRVSSIRHFDQLLE